MPAWIFEEKDVRDDVKLNFPDEWKLRVIHVTSGDSGKKYWVQILHKKLAFENEIPKHKLPITMCDCNEGKFQQPLSVLGLKICCKHAEYALAYIRERK
jgi:hypothetical protein